MSDRSDKIGLTSIAYCAEEFNLSAKYFRDLIKKETGQSAQEYLQKKIISVAKEKFCDKTKQ